ncbi:tRNA-splicing endonuclease subunit Sen34 [Geosmithia morbida]|uniref:tRNA-splicing endonuclease subunit Sen34 n=1 Tax=Geosmithia morbida TaxID=1094350 RepID=A0A9P5D8B2_9HYPO|nr:tRNA-splicing endonuclease subunit Sen34 [Geosmithia morbida]KAF4125344.1 tRNA-splicing endonuclease subunit Sen34 [Geosmithia morbida]
MTTDSSNPQLIRISLIAGRYLVFNQEAVARLRREWNTCGNLVGTVPQQPTQNMFLGLPIELRPEEVDSLVHRGAARVVDDVAAHQAALTSSPGSGDRTAYIESLRRKKQTAQRLLAERTAQKAAEAADRLGRKAHGNSKSRANDAGSDDAVQAGGALLGITPTTSDELVCHDNVFAVTQTPEGPLVRFLQNSGYYMTPGLRFGARYSVYPGDPLRFHAHFMANQYGWDEEVPILDIVQGGRLATAVKKAFVIGGQEPSSQEFGSQDTATRTFSIEWASM